MVLLALAMFETRALFGCSYPNTLWKWSPVKVLNEVHGYTVITASKLTDPTTCMGKNSRRVLSFSIYIMLYYLFYITNYLENDFITFWVVNSVIIIVIIVICFENNNLSFLIFAVEIPLVSVVQ